MNPLKKMFSFLNSFGKTSKRRTRRHRHNHNYGKMNGTRSKRYNKANNYKENNYKANTYKMRGG